MNTLSKRSFYTLLAALICCFPCIAQQSYSFEKGNSAYQDLAHGTVIPFQHFVENNNLFRIDELKGETITLCELPFTFNEKTTLHVQPNGNIRFDNDSSAIVLDGAFTYLDSIDAGSSVSYEITGTPGHHLIKAQWKDVLVRAGKPSNHVSLQIWIYQSSGLLEIHYGPRSANNGSGFTTSTGPQVGIFYAKDDFTKCYEKLWLNGSPADIKIDSSATFSFKALSGIPEEGTVYRFVPRFTHTGFREVTANKRPLLYYPNPASDQLFVDFSGDYRILDMSGGLQMNAQGPAINISKLEPGLYIICDSQGRYGKFIRE